MDVLPDEDVWVGLSADGMLARHRRGIGEFESGREGCSRSHSSRRPCSSSRQTRVTTSTSSAPKARRRASTRTRSPRRPARTTPTSPASPVATASWQCSRSPARRAMTLDSSFLLLATSQGKVKRATLADLFDAASTDPAVIGLDDGDELCWAGVSAGEGGALAGHGVRAGDPLLRRGCPVDGPAGRRHRRDQAGRQRSRGRRGLDRQAAGSTGRPPGDCDPGGLRQTGAAGRFSRPRAATGKGWWRRSSRINRGISPGRFSLHRMSSWFARTPRLRPRRSLSPICRRWGVPRSASRSRP